MTKEIGNKTDLSFLAKDILKAKTVEYANIIALKGDNITKLANKEIDLSNIDEISLDGLVKEKILTAAQKDDLVLTSKIGMLTGENFDLIRAVKTDKIKSPIDFVKWEKEDWVKVIKDKNITIPNDEDSAESYAENICEAIEKSFPTQFFLHRKITNAPVDELLKFSKLKDASPNIAHIVNTYRHLGIDKIIDKDISVQEKQTEISKRFSALNTFYKNNPNINIELTNFSSNLDIVKETRLKWEGIDIELRPAVQRQMAAFQRAYILGESNEVADKLLKGRYDAASKITSMSEEDFIKKSGLEIEKGRRVCERANNLALGASHYFEAIRDGINGNFNDIAVSNQHPLVNDLKEIDGFDKLFGSQNYCDCEEYRSILSPAAYFVDLMYFIQENVSKKVFVGDKEIHPLYLKRRRPDLWKLKLTCHNTSDEIPYLEVVNEVLEDYLKNELSLDDDVYQVLKSADWSMNQPFNLYLEELRLYLSHFDINLYDIYKEMHVDKQKLHREKLKISSEELNIIITKNTAGAIKRFGNKPLNKFDVQEFIEYAGITRGELDDLLKTSSLSEIAKVRVKTIKDNSDIQKYSEVIENLTNNRLDLIHRYLRLWKKTPWSLREYDLLLTALKSKKKFTQLEDKDASGYPQILGIAQLKNIQDTLKLSVEELASITYLLPQSSLSDNERSFVQRVFDLEKINNTLTSDKKPFLLAGLGISESELSILTKLLSIDITKEISIDTLSNLYRHARIANALKMNIEELYYSIILILNGQPFENLEDIEKVIQFSDWVKKSPLNISELAFILKGIETNSNKYKIDFETLSQKVLEIRKHVTTQENPKIIDVGKVLLKEYLQTNFNLTQKQFEDEFLKNLIANDFDSASGKALGANFTNDKPDNKDDFNELIELINKFERYTLLFNKYQFKPDSITYIINHKNVFNINDLKNLNVDDVKNISFYKELILENEDIEPKLQKTLTDFEVNSKFVGNELILAELWKQPITLIESLSISLTFNNPAIKSIKDFLVALKICKQLGIQGNSLVKLTGDDYKVASEIALGAFTSKYDNEQVRIEKLQSYKDKINTLKRDALCNYIISRYDKFKFKDREDLYSFFLLSVEMSGCARTSKLVAAITSLQLYINRCLINLEQSDNNLNPNIADIKVLSTFIPKDEWEWRKNYRVWEANRKVFLYPENYIEPTLRDTKTHIFKELEDELLQQKITKETAEAAYKKYLSQFVELTKLRYAGAYYHRVFDNHGYVKLNKSNTSSNSAFYMLSSLYFPVESDDSCYYLFARTNVQPYQYYYRTYNDNRKVWGNWIKIELGIEAKEISPAIYQGKLYIFWSEVKSKEDNRISDGFSSKGFIFNAYVKYSFLNENGKWSVPQRLSLGQGYTDNKTIYCRVYNVNEVDLERWEKEKDSIVHAYEEKVFRKPYSFVDRINTCTPIGLSYIWTKNKWNSTQLDNAVIYKINAQTLKYPFELYDIEFDCPEQEFRVENNDFSNASKEVSLTARLHYKFWGMQDITIELDGMLELKSPGLCIFSSLLSDNSLNLPIYFNVEVEDNCVYESSFNLSLSRNIITNPSEQNIFGSSQLSVYKKEFSVAYSEDDNFGAYIEDGTKSLSNHIIWQDGAGLGRMQIQNNGNSIPLNTILIDEISDVLYAKGIEQFLSLETQEMTDCNGQQFDFTGPYGEYYWEIFFHIPFLIANHFNANQKFKEAKWWYERIFNPTADEKPGDTKSTDRIWQFREFRNLTPQKLKDILADVKAIEAYKKDPFDPHAIAQLRISSYQKAIVMKYIDNLLDWGDYLFEQDTRESIGEAEMLYQLAYNILGKRPLKVGKCETQNENMLTYEEIGPNIDEDFEFLTMLENYYWTQKEVHELEVGFIKSSKSLGALVKKPQDDINFNRLGKLVSTQRASDLFNKINIPTRNSLPMRTDKAIKFVPAVKSYERIKTSRKERYSRWAEAKKTIENINDFNSLVFKPHKRFPSFDLVKQSNLVFGVPANKELMQYWNRVEDRLYKIWNCMNIKGIRRSLSLFQPPIDPMMLVRLRASGISLEDISALINGDSMPNYRFTYLIEKAKQFAQNVQVFGSALLSALEKKDGEELTLLRSIHEKNILRMTKEIKRSQIAEAMAQYKSTEEGLKNVQNRIEYYNGLISGGLTSWETTQQISRHTATALKLAESVVHLTAGLTYLIPQIGSPFAMKYGGQELGHSGVEFAQWTSSMASICDAVSASASLEATFQRREEEWKYQLKLAEQELVQVNQQLAAAQIRQQIAERDFEIQETNIEQADELYDFYKNKFTNMGLYNYMASTLNRLYRIAYNLAYDMAKLAEKAYRFERFDNAIYIQNDNWQFDKAGLLAAEKLSQQLHELEKKYLESNIRTPEITQTFSLAMLDASQLLDLRQKGSCVIKIPEIAFEILYPGQYRRIIKSVRITIPCIAGPYTNISAKLTLLKGEVKKEGNSETEELGVAKNTSITTSSANNDPGMFDFNFRDERYLPFEGAGAVNSEWQLELPNKLRSFNYDTISDVLLHISYTALDGDRAAAEASLADLIQSYASTDGLFRLFSLRHEFSNSFNLLLTKDSQIADLTIEKIHFPYVLSDRDLIIQQTKVYLKPKKDGSISVPVSMKINGSDINWSSGDDIEFCCAGDNKNKIKGGTVNLKGYPDKKWTIDAGINGLNKEQLEDIIILIKYSINNK